MSRQIQLDVTSMTCASRAERALAAVPGIASHRATIIRDADAAALRNALRQAGPAESPARPAPRMQEAAA